MARGDGFRPERRIRDRRLLDALEAVGQAPYAGTVWRSIREGRDPLACWRSGGAGTTAPWTCSIPRKPGKRLLPNGAFISTAASRSRRPGCVTNSTNSGFLSKRSCGFPIWRPFRPSVWKPGGTAGSATGNCSGNIRARRKSPKLALSSAPTACSPRAPANRATSNLIVFCEQDTRDRQGSRPKPRRTGIRGHVKTT